MSTERRSTPDRSSKVARGARAVVDGLLAVALCYSLYLIGSAAANAANARTELRVLKAEAEALFDGFQRYNERNHGYPPTYTGSTFDVESLDPLSKRGYYRGSLTGHLRDARVDAYDSPDDLGPNREFWVEMTMRADPSIRILVARSDDAPLGGGTWREGVFVFRNGELVED